MCTVTFIARRSGYALGMNRDEKLARVAGLPPAEQRCGGRGVLCPSEPGGGTWIGVNDTGVTVALINWYSVPDRAREKVMSRGELVRGCLPADSVRSAGEALAAVPLERVNPFRLIGVFPATREVVEWRWNLRRLDEVHHPWRTGIWISSGFDEPGAQQTRGKVFREALRQKTVGSVEWLRRLHRSHSPECGPYSICMHRADAATVSYTEVVVGSNVATMRYTPAAPCSGQTKSIRRLTRRRQTSSRMLQAL